MNALKKRYPWVHAYVTKVGMPLSTLTPKPYLSAHFSECSAQQNDIHKEWALIFGVEGGCELRCVQETKP